MTRKPAKNHEITVTTPYGKVTYKWCERSGQYVPKPSKEKDKVKS